MSSVPGSPSARLELSRERLRQAMHERSPPRGAGAPPRGAWFDGLLKVPGAGLVIEALRAWWARHPLRLAVSVGAEAARAVAQPLARRHPLGVVLGAALLGGAFAWSRPWRWITRTALFAGLLPQLLATSLAYQRRNSEPPAARERSNDQAAASPSSKNA